jgi:asparagine synthase (glutamine-hydrolysing)
MRGANDNQTLIKRICPHADPMPEPSDSLMRGAPRFSAGAAARAEAQSGPLAAWQQAWRDSAAAAGPDSQAAAAAQTALQAQGHFAAGLHDGAGRTLLAVDRFATHTLCYRTDGDQLLFSERADELAVSHPEIDPQALFDYLYFHAIPSPRTIFRGVHRLPAGHFALFDQGQLSVAPYWKPQFQEARSASFGDTRQQFRQLLADAVATQLDGTRPAAFLSGGTDSSTVAGLLAQVSGQAPATYSIGFEAEGYDEMAYARLAAKHFGTDHHEYYVTPDDLVAGIPKLAAHHDQPFGNSSALPAYCCALRAREDGVTRLLAGDGGDEVFGGNTRYAKQRVFGWYGRVPPALRTGVLEPLAGNRLVNALPLLRKGASYVQQARVPMPDRLQTYNLLHRLGVHTMLTPAFLSRVDTRGPQALERQVWQGAQGASDINQMLAYDWRFTLAENDLPKVRSSTELASVSAGYPFLDQALVDFSLGLPSRYKLKGMKLRWFFKEALRGFLPDEIITKKKHGFGLPFGVWANRHAGLHALASESLRSFAQRGVVKPEFVRTLLDVHLPAHPGYYGEMVWILMMLEQWLQQHAPDWKLQA